MTFREVPFLKRILNLRSVFAVNALVLVGLFIGLGRTYWNNLHLRREIDALETQAATLESKTIEIKKLKEYLSSQEFLENEARLKLGLQKPGEEAIVVEGLSGESVAGNNEKGVDGAGANESWLENPKKWWGHFFKH